jgi:hypothetical protein
MIHTKIYNLGELIASGYQPKTIKDELRDNLIVALKNKVKVFEGIWGFEDTVIPDVEPTPYQPFGLAWAGQNPYCTPDGEPFG